MIADTIQQTGNDISHGTHHLIADLRMLFHQAVFFFRQPSRFVQYIIRHPDLTDIMNQPDITDTHQVYRIQPVALCHLFCQTAGIKTDTPRMPTCIFIPGIDGAGDGLNGLNDHIRPCICSLPAGHDFIIDGLDDRCDHQHQKCQAQTAPEYMETVDVEPDQFRSRHDHETDHTDHGDLILFHPASDKIPDDAAARYDRADRRPNMRDHHGFIQGHKPYGMQDRIEQDLQERNGFQKHVFLMIRPVLYLIKIGHRKHCDQFHGKICKILG